MSKDISHEKPKEITEKEMIAKLLEINAALLVRVAEKDAEIERLNNLIRIT